MKLCLFFLIVYFPNLCNSITVQHGLLAWFGRLASSVNFEHGFNSGLPVPLAAPVVQKEAGRD